jgi:hypothetical protein
MWQFDKIRQFAIEQMSKRQLDVLEKVGLARDHRVKEWLLPALNAYTRLGRPMGIEDVNHLGLDLVLKIVSIRESTPVSSAIGCRHCNRPTVAGPLRTNIDARKQTDFTDGLRKAFQTEIAAPWRKWSMHKAASAPPVDIISPSTETVEP